VAEFAEVLNPDRYNEVLNQLLEQGVSRRVAEGKARRVAMVEYKREHPEEHEAAPTRAPEGDGDGQPAAAPAAAAAGAPAGVGAPVGVATAAPIAVAAPAAPITAPPPTGKVPQPKAGVADKHRLLALVAPEGIQRVEREQGDRVNTFPHLLIQELLSLIIVSAALTVFSIFVNAPLRELANPNLTPNPSKAPWYFLGLQELLRYFHPMVAGVLVPTLFFGLLFLVPYVDRNPSTKPGDRKMAMVLWTMLLMFFAILTIIGAFYRGLGFNFVPPHEGVYFDL
jgi:menaquinol-cytochrome c reductase cytochrome b/c subunit